MFHRGLDEQASASKSERSGLDNDRRRPTRFHFSEHVVYFRNIANDP
jgi:hypothetical protein